MIKFFQKYETDKYVIIKILFIKITFKKKMPSINLGYINKKALKNELHKAIKDLKINN